MNPAVYQARPRKPTRIPEVERPLRVNVSYPECRRAWPPSPRRARIGQPSRASRLQAPCRARDIPLGFFSGGVAPMRMMLPVALLLVLLCGTASALTVQEVVALSKAGVSDEVLLSLIDRDKTIFAIDNDQLIALTRDRISERLVLA